MSKRLTLSLLFLTLATGPLAAQSAASSAGPLRVSAISGSLSHSSALVVDPSGTSDTRLSAGATFGVEAQYAAFSLGSIYGGVAASFSTLQHGSSLGAVAGPGSSAATIILGTAGIVIEASDWFANVRPTLRLGGGLKYYSFTTSGASSSATPTGDIGIGFRGGAGTIEIFGEMRYLPSAFDQAKLPLGGVAPQDQQQNDFLFTVGVTVRP